MREAAVLSAHCGKAGDRVVPGRARPAVHAVIPVNLDYIEEKGRELKTRFGEIFQESFIERPLRAPRCSAGRA